MRAFEPEKGTGETAPLTGVEARQKPIRLIDERPKGGA